MSALRDYSSDRWGDYWAARLARSTEAIALFRAGAPRSLVMETLVGPVTVVDREYLAVGPHAEPMTFAAYNTAQQRALRRTIDILSGHEACPYCGSPAHHLHEFRQREVCSGCGAFWE